MDGWVFAIGDQRTDVFGKGEVKRHGNNGGSEGVAANHQHSGGDATDERNWIHGSKEIRLNAGAADDAPVVRFTAIGVSAYDTSLACQPCVQLGVRRTHSSTKLQCWTGFISE